MVTSLFCSFFFQLSFVLKDRFVFRKLKLNSFTNIFPKIFVVWFIQLEFDVDFVVCCVCSLSGQSCLRFVRTLSFFSFNLNSLQPEIEEDKIKTHEPECSISPMLLTCHEIKSLPLSHFLGSGVFKIAFQSEWQNRSVALRFAAKHGNCSLFLSIFSFVNSIFSISDRARAFPSWERKRGEFLQDWRKLESTSFCHKGLSFKQYLIISHYTHEY
jgi:hypothetical protein